MHLPDIPTPVGIRQSYMIHEVSKQVCSWDREALKGLTYLLTDRSSWHKMIGRAEDANCKLCKKCSVPRQLINFELHTEAK